MLEVSFAFLCSQTPDMGRESHPTSVTPRRMETTSWATCTSDLKITLSRGAESGRKAAEWATSTCPPWGHAVGSIMRFWGINPYVGPTGQQLQQPSRDETWGQDLVMERSLRLPRVFQGQHCCPCPEVPGVPVRYLGLCLAFSKPAASRFTNMEEWLFINALLSFGVKRKSSPSRQTVALHGVAEPILADCAWGCTINLLLKAASFSYLRLPNVVEKTLMRENRSH